MDPSRLCVLILFSVNFVYSAPVVIKTWCEFPPKVLIDANPSYIEPCSNDTLPGLKTICDRIDIVSDCYFVIEEGANFPATDLIGNIYDEESDGDRDTRVKQTCEFMSEMHLLKVTDDCQQICKDAFFVCDLYVAMDKVLRQYFIREIGNDGSNFQRLEIFIHSGKYSFLFPYPLERSLHSTSQLESCMNQAANNTTVTACKLVGALAVKFVQAGKLNSYNPIQFLKHLTQPWDPCQAMANFTDFQLPGIEVLKDNQTCKTICSEKNVDICKTLLLGFKAFDENLKAGIFNEKIEEGKVNDTHAKIKPDGSKASETKTGDNDNVNDKIDDIKDPKIDNDGDEKEGKYVELEPDHKQDKTNVNITPANEGGKAGEIDKNENNDIDIAEVASTSLTDPDKSKTNHESDSQTTNNPDSTEGPGINSKEEKINDVVSNTVNDKTTKTVDNGNAEDQSKLGTEAPKEKTDEKKPDNGNNDNDTEMEPSKLEPTNTDDDNDKIDDNEDGNTDVGNNDDNDNNGNDVDNDGTTNEVTDDIDDSKDKDTLSPYMSSSPTSPYTKGMIDDDDDGENDSNDLDFDEHDDNDVAPSKPDKTVDVHDKGTKTKDDAYKYQQSEIDSNDYDDDEEGSGGHFMAYFLVFIVLCVAGYIIFHNKQKIMALVIEGKVQSSSRRPSTKEYKRLKTEDVMPSLEKSAYSKNYVF